MVNDLFSYITALLGESSGRRTIYEVFRFGLDALSGMYPGERCGGARAGSCCGEDCASGSHGGTMMRPMVFGTRCRYSLLVTTGVCWL